MLSYTNTTEDITAWMTVDDDYQAELGTVEYAEAHIDDPDGF